MPNKWETGESVRKALGDISVALRCQLCGKLGAPPLTLMGDMGGECCSAKGIPRYGIEEHREIMELIIPEGEN